MRKEKGAGPRTIVQAGRAVVPFADFNEHFTNDSFVKAIGETQGDALVVGFGNDFLEVSGGAFEGREAVYCEQARDRFMSDAMMTMVRTAGHKLVHFLEGEHGQLFDLDADPLEERNLWSEPATAAMRRELLDRLAEWRMRSQLHTADWAAAAR